jgi:flagellar motility protein MotE (MotC chaperone)
MTAVASAQQGWEPIVQSARVAKSSHALHTREDLPPARLTAAPADPKPPIWTAALPAPEPERVQKRVEPVAGGEPSLARQFCVNIADAAADARFVRQKKLLSDMEQELEKRIALLEAKTLEFQKWVSRRDEFSKKAQDHLVLIYSRMRSEAAALQLVAMEEETAAAILTKLDPRVSSAILNEMDAAHAARLTATISGAAKVSPRKEKIP